MSFMQAVLEKLSFAAGQISKKLWHRNDLQRQQTGAALLRNMVVLIEGGVTRLPGTRFVAPVKNEAQDSGMIEFRASADDQLMLILNAGKMRVYRNAGVVETSPGTPYELAVPFAAADIDDIRFAQSVDQMFFAWNGAPKLLTRLANDNWTIGDYQPTNGPTEPQNTDRARTIYASATTGTVTLYASVGSNMFVAGDVGSVWRLDEFDLSQIAPWTANETVAPGGWRRNRGAIYEVISGTNTGVNAPVHDDGDWLSEIGKVTWRFVSTASGYVRITAFIDSEHATAVVTKTLPPTLTFSPTYRWFRGEWCAARGFPDNVSLATDGSLVWSRGDKWWKTRPGDFYDYDASLTDLSGLASRLAAPEIGVQDIRYILPTTPLIFGTADVEWVIRGNNPYDALAPLTTRQIPDTGEGAAKSRARLVDGGAIFIGRSRKRAHFVKFDRLAEGVKPQEVSQFSREILAAGVQAVAWQRDPNRLLWFRMGDGTARILTFMPEEQVIGWATVELKGGFIERIGAIQSADGTASEIWLIVRRTIAGATRRYIEVAQPFFEPLDEAEPTAEGAWFVQCGLRYQGPATATIAGLDHLENETLNIHADGVQQPSKKVVGGAITLARAASDVIAGLPLDFKIATLPFELATNKGTSRDDEKRAPKWKIYVANSAPAGDFTCNGGEPELIFPRGDAEPGPVKLETGAFDASPDSPWDSQLTGAIEGDTTLPFTLTGLAPDVRLRGG